MKPNKEKVYDFIKLHAVPTMHTMQALHTLQKSNEFQAEQKGISTDYIAKAMNLQRTNVSSSLNALVKEGRIGKTNGRPVLYYLLGEEETKQEDCFTKLVGYEGSLKHVIQLAKAAVLYPGKSLNVTIFGVKGTGKKLLAKLIYQYAIESKVLGKEAPFIEFNCKEYMDEGRMAEDLFGYEQQSGAFERAVHGILFLDNIQTLSGRIRTKIIDWMNENPNCPMVIASCTDKKQEQNEAFIAEFPILLEVPSLKERPFEERMELVQFFLSKEAGKINRTLVVKPDLLRCLLLYECEADCLQLETDIKIGCANAYVREYKKKDEMQLFLTDFEHYVRKGILRYKLFKTQIDELVLAECSYHFRGDGVEQEIEKNELQWNMYEEISKKAFQLSNSGLEENEIHLILSMDVEHTFHRYQEKLVKGVANKEQLSVLVDQKIIELVENFLREATVKLERIFPNSIFYGLCIHIKNMIEQQGNSRKIDQRQVTELLANYKTEYLLCAEFANQIGREYGIEISLDEVLFLTMFLSYQDTRLPIQKKPVVLFAFYGEGIASSIVKTIIGFTQLDHIYAYELAFERDSTEVYSALKEYIQKIHLGKGIIVVYDSTFLSDMLSEIEEELSIEIRQIQIPVISMGIDLVRKTMLEDDVDRIYQEVVGDIGVTRMKMKKIIVTLCTTGKGGAEELKRYIEQFGNVEDTEIVPLSITDTAALTEELKKRMKTGVIQCLIGTYNPNLFSIPFIPISEIFGTPKENLPQVLKKGRKFQKRYDEAAIFAYLKEQLTYTNITKLKKVLPEMLKEINKCVLELSLDTEVGLFVHIACCIDRLCGKQAPVQNTKKKMILERYDAEYRKLLKIVRPAEKTFHIIFSEDEIANLLTIIYQI